MPRHHGVLWDWVGGRRLFRKWNSARHQGPGASEAGGCGKRSELFILALGFVLKDDKLNFASYYKLPAAQADTENCVAHNGSLIPVPGRDIEVQAWYQGGISIVDFTDATHPFEIAYFDRGPIDPNVLVLGGDWSAYWYNGYIYGSEIV